MIDPLHLQAVAYLAAAIVAAVCVTVAEMMSDAVRAAAGVEP